MLREPPGANEGNHIQAKFAMGERPASFLFGMISHVIPRAGGGGTLMRLHNYGCSIRDIARRSDAEFARVKGDDKGK